MVEYAAHNGNVASSSLAELKIFKLSLKMVKYNLKMPQVDIFSFILQIQLLILFIFIFLFCLDKFLIYFIYDINKLKILLKIKNINFLNLFYSYKKNKTILQFFLYFNNI